MSKVCSQASCGVAGEGGELALDEVGPGDHPVQVGVGAATQARRAWWRIGEDASNALSMSRSKRATSALMFEP